MTIFDLQILETFLVGALYKEFQKFVRILMAFLGKSTEIHHNSNERPKHLNYDGFLWIFPSKAIRIRMNFQNSLYNAPTRKVSKNTLTGIIISRSASRVVPSSQKQFYKRKKKSQDLWFSLCWTTKAKAKENVGDFNLSRKWSLLLWLARAQHGHYESESERDSGGIYLPFHYESESEIKSPDFRV